MLNTHPMFVHFPVALFVVYGLLELVRFKKITDLPFWFPLKAVLVILGVASALAAIGAGEAIEHIFDGDPVLERVVKTHALFALLTTILFAILAISYVVVWSDNLIRQRSALFALFAVAWEKIFKAARFILSAPVVIILAILGLIGITITASLGASLVYGPNVDPVVNFVYSLFF